MPTDKELRERYERELAANRRYQADWRKRHFALHGEICNIVRSLAQTPDLLDKLGNPKLAKTIRKAAQEIGAEL